MELKAESIITEAQLKAHTMLISVLLGSVLSPAELKQLHAKFTAPTATKARRRSAASEEMAALIEVCLNKPYDDIFPMAMKVASKRTSRSK